MLKKILNEAKKAARKAGKFAKYSVLAASMLASLALKAPAQELPNPIEPENLARREMSLPEIDRGLIQIRAKDDVYDGVSDYLDIYEYCLKGEGYRIERVKQVGETPEQIKDNLREKYEQDGLVAMICVGDVPHAEFEYTDKEGYHKYPCDTFFSNLEENEWQDNDKNGIFDKVEPNYPIERQFWLARMQPTGNTQERVYSIKWLLDKAIAYRIMHPDMNRENSGVGFVDYYFWGDIDVQKRLSKIFGDAVEIPDHSKNAGGTNAEEYKEALLQNNKLLYLRAHSSYMHHQFKNSNEIYTSILSEDIRDLKAKPLFYILETCSSCDFSEDNCIGNSYIFGAGDGTVVAGSTKEISSMFYPGVYDALAENKCFGEAMKKIDMGVEGYDDESGLALLGDPTATINRVNVGATLEQFIVKEDEGLVEITVSNTGDTAIQGDVASVRFHFDRLVGEDSFEDKSIADFLPPEANGLLQPGESITLSASYEPGADTVYKAIYVSIDPLDRIKETSSYEIDGWYFIAAESDNSFGEVYIREPKITKIARHNGKVFIEWDKPIQVPANVSYDLEYAESPAGPWDDLKQGITESSVEDPIGQEVVGRFYRIGMNIGQSVEKNQKPNSRRFGLGNRGNNIRYVIKYK